MNNFVLVLTEKQTTPCPETIVWIHYLLVINCWLYIYCLGGRISSFYEFIEENFVFEIPS